MIVVLLADGSRPCETFCKNPNLMPGNAAVPASSRFSHTIAISCHGSESDFRNCGSGGGRRALRPRLPNYYGKERTGNVDAADHHFTPGVFELMSGKGGIGGRSIPTGNGSGGLNADPLGGE